MWIIPAGALAGGVAGYLAWRLFLSPRQPAGPGEGEAGPGVSPSGPVILKLPEPPPLPPRVDPADVARSHTARAVHFEAEGDLPQARDHFLKALSLYESVNNVRGVLYTCDLLAALHVSLKDTAGAETYWRYALSLATARELRTQEVRLLGRLGLAAAEGGRWDEARDLLGEALKMEEALWGLPVADAPDPEQDVPHEDLFLPGSALAFWEMAARLAPEGSAFAALCTQTLEQARRRSAADPSGPPSAVTGDG